MKSSRPSISLGLARAGIAFVILSLAVLIMVAHAAAQSATEKVLFSFAVDGDLGNTPNGYLISDAAGNLYGVNTYGGLGSGDVYELYTTEEGGSKAILRKDAGLMKEPRAAAGCLCSSFILHPSSF